MNEDLPTRLLNIYLVREGTDSKAIVLPDKSKEPIQFTAHGQSYELYIKPSVPSSPSWHTFFEGHVAKEEFGLTSSAGAVLITKVDKRYYALMFGIAKHMLRTDVIQEGFGMKVVLNTVEKVRSIDKDTFDAIGGKTRTQASFDVGIGEFGFDIEKDLLKVVVGTPVGEIRHFGIRMAGVDSLKVLIPFELSRLPDLLRGFYRQSQLVNYKKLFGFVDKIAPITEESLIGSLDEIVATQMSKDGNNRSIRLSIPDIVDLSKIPFFRYKLKPHARENFFDVNLEGFLKTAEAGKWEITPDLLRNKHVYKVDEYDEARPLANIYRCINADIEHNREKFILTSGRWYRVEDKFIQNLNEFVANLDQYDQDFPDFSTGWSPSIEEPAYSETIYNARFNTANPSFISYDLKFLYPEKGQKFEFCDLYSEEFGFNDLVHVKRAKDSQTLSNVFAQATVAAESFLNSEEIRLKWNSLLPPKWKIPNCKDFPDASKYRVVFALVMEKETPLPFFARVNLRQAFDKLRNWRYKPKIKYIQVDPTWRSLKTITRRKKL